MVNYDYKNQTWRINIMDAKPIEMVLNSIVPHLKDEQSKKVVQDIVPAAPLNCIFALSLLR